MRLKGLVAAAVMICVSATTMAYAMPSGPGVTGTGQEAGAMTAPEMPEALRRVNAQHPVPQAVLVITSRSIT